MPKDEPAGGSATAARSSTFEGGEVPGSASGLIIVSGQLLTMTTKHIVVFFNFVYMYIYIYTIYPNSCFPARYAAIEHTKKDCVVEVCDHSTLQPSWAKLLMQQWTLLYCTCVSDVSGKR